MAQVAGLVNALSAAGLATFAKEVNHD